MTEHPGKPRLYEIREAVDGQFYYAQIGRNGEVLDTSERYTRREDAERSVFDANPTYDPRLITIKHVVRDHEGTNDRTIDPDPLMPKPEDNED